MNLSFNTLYQKLLADHQAPLEKMRRELAVKYTLITLFGVVCIVLAVLFKINDKLVGIIIGLIVFGFVALCSKLHASYIQYFKKHIIRAFIGMIDPNLQYEPEVSRRQRDFMMARYNTANFDSLRPNEIEMDDLITGTAGGYKVDLCDVSLEAKLGRYGTHLFTGLFAHLTTDRKLDGFIKITRNKLIKTGGRTKLDDNEFEKHFDVSSSARILAMQYLTADVMALLTRFKEKTEMEFDLFWQQRGVEMRFKTGAMFEPRIYDRSLAKDTLENYVKILTFVIEFNQLVGQTVESTYL